MTHKKTIDYDETIDIFARCLDEFGKGSIWTVSSTLAIIFDINKMKVGDDIIMRRRLNRIEENERLKLIKARNRENNRKNGC